MNDPRRRGISDHDPQGSESTRWGGNRYSADPAYTDQVPYAPTYSSAQGPSSSHTGQSQLTEQYWLQGHAPPDWQHGHPPGEGPDGDGSHSGQPKSPRWLWIAAIAAVLLVVALVIALVISNISAENETALPPLPAMPNSSTSFPTTAPLPTTTTSAPATPTPTTSPGTPGQANDVVYNVTGEGRAISISYVDDDGVMQIEFNVALPWSKEVSLPNSGNHRATVTVVNIGHEVTCSLTVGGVQVRQHSGVGLTVCDAPS